MSIPVRISGGAGGIVANREAIAHLADCFGVAGVECVWVASGARADASGLGPLSGHGPAGWADLAGFERASAVLADAVGMLDRGIEEVQALAGKLRSAAAGYPWGSDALSSGVFDRVEGVLAGLSSLSLTTVRAAGLQSPAADRAAGLDAATIDLLVDTAGVAEAGALLTLAVPDGSGTAVRTGRVPVAAPRGVGDLVTGLAAVDRSGGPGGIDVRILTGPDGSRRAVVDISGTRTWGGGGSNPADLRTNAGGLAAENGAYSQGVLHALRRAGVRSDEPVMLVGHSQGGMVAVAAARQAAASGEFTVSHVLTAGSPIGRSVGALPSSVRVLALENTRDVVPMLDGAANPDRPNVTTVSGRIGGPGGVGFGGASHAVDDAYRPLADAAVAAGGRSITDYLDSARDFFTAQTAEQHRFRVERH